MQSDCGTSNGQQLPKNERHAGSELGVVSSISEATSVMCMLEFKTQWRMGCDHSKSLETLEETGHPGHLLHKGSITNCRTWNTLSC